MKAGIYILVVLALLNNNCYGGYTADSTIRKVIEPQISELKNEIAELKRQNEDLLTRLTFVTARLNRLEGQYTVGELPRIKVDKYTVKK